MVIEVFLALVVALPGSGDGARGDGAPGAAERHWAFVPPAEPAVPETVRSSWCAGPVDAFVLDGLRAAGLEPAPPAAPPEIVRRVTYDLTGLPPTPEEVEDFLADDSPDALSRLLDRLLASPRYGERWGRHWLDVARYADSNGVDENLAYANAFRYRDWVIASFNRDTSFDRFIHEQIAGDLLPAAPGETDGQRIDRLVATGFLSIGPKMLACDDGTKMELDIVDEQLDTLSRAFMGVTMSCARCHDHKFDPITTKEYYALAGILKSTKTMENFKVVAEWHEHVVATEAERARFDAWERRLDEAKSALEERHREERRDLVEAERAGVTRYLAAAAELLSHGDLDAADGREPIAPTLADEDLASRGLLLEAEAFQRGTLTVDTTTWGAGIGVLLHSGHAEYDLQLPRDGHYQLELRYAALESRPMVISIDGLTVTTDGVSRTTGGWHPKHQRWHVEGVFELRAGSVLRLERSAGPVPHVDKILLVALPDGETGVTIGGLVRKHGLREPFFRQWVEALRGDAALRDTIAGGSPDDLAGRESIRALVADDKAGPFRLPDKPESLYSPSVRDAIAALEAEKKRLEESRPSLPRAMGVREGEVTDLRVHVRGDYLELGEAAPRGFPSVLGGDAGSPIDTRSSGRLALARWLTRHDHPLTARVAANRVWLWHFGDGLVRSPDNFGTLGDRPVHATLLDWLALRLAGSGWSIKSLHRTIMLSATYGMSTRHDGDAIARDPENRLLWRFPRRRLEAEAVRDSLLALGGSLDLAMGGQLLPDGNRDYVTGTGSKGATYDFDRRSVYLPVLRSAVYDVFQTFDFADPSVIAGRRDVTTVASQALFMMNGELVNREMRRFAARLLSAIPDDDRERVRRAYLEAFSRPPTAREIDRCLDFVRGLGEELERESVAPDERRLGAWHALCRALVASNEFMYLE